MFSRTLLVSLAALAVLAGSANAQGHGAAGVAMTLRRRAMRTVSRGLSIFLVTGVMVRRLVRRRPLAMGSGDRGQARKPEPGDNGDGQ